MRADVVFVTPGVSIPSAALTFSAVRASGPGGQNVNRRATKVELRVAVYDVPIDELARTRLRRLASHLLTDDDELIIVCDESRSQRRNREACVARLGELVRASRVTPKRRIATRPTRASKQRRLDAKKQRGELKRRRKPPEH